MSSINVVDCNLEVKKWCVFGSTWTWTCIQDIYAYFTYDYEDYIEYSGANWQAWNCVWFDSYVLGEKERNLVIS